MSKRTWAEVPHIIRNMQTRQWPAHVMRVGIIGAGFCCLCAVVLVPHPFFHLLTAAAILFLLAALGCALFVLLSRPIHKIVIGERMETWPGRNCYSLTDIEQIEFISEPEDDYQELTPGNEIRKARLTVRSPYRTFSFNLSLSPPDASKLLRWASKYEIRVIGAVASR